MASELLRELSDRVCRGIRSWACDDGRRRAPWLGGRWSRSSAFACTGMQSSSTREQQAASRAIRGISRYLLQWPTRQQVSRRTEEINQSSKDCEHAPGGVAKILLMKRKISIVLHSGGKKKKRKKEKGKKKTPDGPPKSGLFFYFSLL
jgi:hypothetical protein